MSFNPGQLNRRITYVKAGTAASDGIGGVNVTAGDSVTTWARVQPMNLAEALRYGLADGSKGVTITMYYEQGKNVLQGSDITYESEVYRVKSVIEVDEEKVYCQIIAYGKS